MLSTYYYFMMVHDIRAGVVVAVALHEIDHAPNAKSGSKCHNKGLQNVYC